MSLIPSDAFRGTYAGSIDDAIRDHLRLLGLQLDTASCNRIRDICINILKLRAHTGRGARNASYSHADLRARPADYARVHGRQSGRCAWCGIDLSAVGVRTSLDHVSPKHIGDDMSDTSNWALTCQTCNEGKGDSFTWAASSFASGYLRAQHFLNPEAVVPEARWAILARDGGCEFCGALPAAASLWVYRRLRSGLAIPTNCSTTCEGCARTRGLDVLTPAWVSIESTRAYFVP